MVAGGPSQYADQERLAQQRGQAAITNACLAYEIYEPMLVSERWKALGEAGARPQRLLWASTGVKDKAFSDTRYVTELVAPNTVNTMPEATLRAVADHGEVRGDVVRSSYAAARTTAAALRKAGVAIDDVAHLLEEQGVASFAKSWDELIKSITEQMQKAGAAVMPAGSVKPATGTQGQSAGPAAGAPHATAAGRPVDPSHHLSTTHMKLL